MRPIELAKVLLRKQGLCLETMLAEHLGNPAATVVVRPHCFAMGKAVEVASEETRNVDPSAPLRCAQDDKLMSSQRRWAWHVSMAVGDLRELVTLFPFRLPFVCFTRQKGDGKLRVYRTDRLVGRIRKRRTPNAERRTPNERDRQAADSTTELWRIIYG